MTPDDDTMAGRASPVGDLIASLACLAGCIGFLVLALALPPGHSTGDSGPGALPEQVAVFGILCSLSYVLLVFRGAFKAQRPDFSSSLRALAAFAIFALCLMAVGWIGLPSAIALAATLVTFLFSGQRRLMRGLATGIGTWLIAVLLFGKLLGLPMP